MEPLADNKKPVSSLDQMKQFLQKEISGLDTRMDLIYKQKILTEETLREIYATEIAQRSKEISDEKTIKIMALKNEWDVKS